MGLKRLALFVLIVCFGVSGCGRESPAQPLTSCFSADLTVTDGDLTYGGRLTVGERSYEWVLAAPPSVAGFRLCCDGAEVRLFPDEGAPLTAAMGTLPPDGIPTVLWCALFDSDREPPTRAGDAAVSEGDTPVGRYRLRTDGTTGYPLSLQPLTVSWEAVFERCTVST